MRWRSGLVTGVLVCAGLMAPPAVASAATISESFSPASIPLTGTTTLTFAIDNPGGSPHSVIFDDTLPSGVQVAGTPTTVTLSSPAPGQVYAFGQKLTAAFSCADDPNGPGVQSCVGTVPIGSPIATGKAGAHSFTVTATSLDGGVASDTVFYSVAPDNRFTVTRRHGDSDGSVDFVVKVPWPSRITELAKVQGARFTFGRSTASARRAGKLHLTIVPTARGSQAVQHHQGPLRVTVTVGYTPKGGTLRTVRFVLTV